MDHKVYIYTEKDVYRCYLRFSELKKQLHNCGFCQINQSTLVNSIHIKSVRIEKDCHRSITLDNEECLIVNRRYRSFLKDQV
ncbi:LytTR family transcriptional regulator [[Clostridium] innocuum]|nr:LytTR family transcriptional regulator [[Clostridium] innocuum]